MKKYDEIIQLFEQTRDNADELIKFYKILMYDNYMSDNVLMKCPKNRKKIIASISKLQI